MSAELSVRSPMPLRALSRLAKSNDAFAILPAGKTRKKTRQKNAPKKRIDAMHGNASAGGAMTRAFDIGCSPTDVGR